MLVPCNAQAEAQVQATRSRDCPVFCEGRGRVKLTTAILTKARMGRDDSDEGISFRQEIEELGLIRNPKVKVSRRGASIEILIPCSEASIL